jgi:hypothetical protein
MECDDDSDGEELDWEVASSSDACSAGMLAA